MRPEAGPLWKDRDYLCLSVGETVSTLGGAAAAFAAPLIVLTMTGSAGAAGVVATAGMAGNFAALPLAGALVDGQSRRAMMMSGQLLRLMTWTGLALCISVHWFQLATFAILSFAGGAAAAIYRAAEAGALKALVPPQQLPTAVAVIEGRGAAADLAGAPLGGALLTIALPLPLWVNAATFLAAVVGIASIRAPLGRPTQGPAEGLVRSTLAGIRFIARQPGFSAILASQALLNFGLNAFIFTVIVTLQRGAHPYWLISFYPAAAGLGLLAGSILAPRMVARCPVGSLVTAAAVASLASMALISLVISRPVFLLAVVALGSLAAPAANAGSLSYLASVTPPVLQGRVFAAEEFTSSVAIPGGTVLAGLMIEGVGETATRHVLTSVVGLAVALLVLSPGVRSLPTLSSIEEASA